MRNTHTWVSKQQIANELAGGEAVSATLAELVEQDRRISDKLVQNLALAEKSHLIKRLIEARSR